MKKKKLDKKIKTIYINHSKSPKIKRKTIELPKAPNNYLTTKYELINQIINHKMNLICFDCRKKTPKYISINNAIFLCPNCALIHKNNFPEKISFIIENNLNLLSINYLRLLLLGGNQNLDNFINYIFPGLQNYSPKILYRTQALIYYRDNLKYGINEGPEPKRPNELMAYKIVSEKGLINIREQNNTIFYKDDLNVSMDNTRNTYSKNHNNNVLNNYFNNFNNTYNTYNNISISSENQENEKEKINIGTSLSNKEFFNEMKSLFGKRYIKAFKNSINLNKKLTSFKSFNIISKAKKTKTQKSNDLNEYINKPLSFRLNESLNYSFAKNKEINKNNFKNMHLNYSNLNKSSISIIRDKTPNNFGKSFIISQKYTKPNMKNMKKNFGISKKYIENGKLKKIYNNRDKFNNIIQQKNVLKYFKIQKKAKSFFKSKDNNKKIKSIPINNNNKNLKLNFGCDNTLFKEKIFQKINKRKENNIYLKTDYINKSNVLFQNNNKENKIDQNNNIIPCYNNCNKKTRIFFKKNNMNVSFDEYNKKTPIKVNLRMNLERKKQALKDKNEQEKIEKEALNSNLFFDSKENYNDIFTNIIYLNNSNIA